MKEDLTYVKRIQSRLCSRKNNGKKLPNVSYKEIKEIISNTDKFQSIDYQNMSVDEISLVTDFIHQQRLKSADKIVQVSNANDCDLVVTESDSSAKEVADTSSELMTRETTEISVSKTDINQLAPHEAVALIQEIASDDTSKNKLVAKELLKQLDNKTDSIVALVAALPDIEAEMLRRKLQQIDRKTVDYEAILGSHFRESTTELTDHISSLAAEYGVTI